MTDGREYDVVVVGGGAAGLSGALVLARARRRVAVVDGGQPRNVNAGHVHGFLTRDGLPPDELLELGRAEVRGYGGDLVDGTVVEAAPRPDGFDVRLADGTVLGARRLLVTTGLTDRLPELPGIRRRWGVDVLHCPYCHGREFADRPIAVLGVSSLSIHQALLVRQWSDDVVLVEHELDELAADDRERLEACDIGIVPGRVIAFAVVDGALTGVEVTAPGPDATRTVPCAALFLEPHFVGNTALLEALGCERTRHGWVETDECGLTTAPRVYAAGNVNDPGAQVISAAGDAARAAIALNSDLLEEDVERTVAAGCAARDRRAG